MLKKLTYRDNWIRALIAFFMVLLVAIPIAEADLVHSYELLPVLMMSATIGFAAGILLAISRFPTLTAHIYSFVYGAFTITWIIGLQLTETLEWRDKVADMLTRQADWLLKAINGGSSRDALIFVMHTAVIMWVLGYGAAWFTMRGRRVWRAIVPGAIVLLSVVYYYFGPKPLLLYLALYCVLALVYLALSHLANNKEEWLFAQVRYERGITGTFVRSGLIVSLIAMLIAWSLPTLAANPRIGDAVSNVDQPWQQFRNEWQRMFSALSSQTSVASDPRRDDLTLGGARNPGDANVMDVFVDVDLPYAYWRSYIYDTYTDDGRWDAVNGEGLYHEPDEPAFDNASAANRVTVEQEFLNLIPNVATLYAAPDFVQSDRPINVYTTYDDAGFNEITHVRSRYRLGMGDRYSMVSQMSFADEASLRQAGTDYADTLAAQYLQLPDSITDRTKALATDLTAAFDNPYDKAIAVQNYLRNTITYSDQIAAPPDDVEAVDYFLFETQTGYCNYYASAFSVMLRLQGIPTRISSGYAAGEYNEDNNMYRVRARDSHTWPEVYFPGYGWIQFEPTVIIEPPGRDPGEEAELELTPTPEADDPENDEEPLPTPTPTPIPFNDEFDPPSSSEPDSGPDWLNRDNLLRALGAVALLAIAAGLMFVGWRSNQAVEGDVNRSYGRLGLWAKWLRLTMRPSYTPGERADIMADAVPEGQQPIRRLISEYARRQYSPRKDGSRRFKPLEEWRELRPLLFKTGLRERLPSWLQRFVK